MKKKLKKLNPLDIKKLKVNLKRMKKIFAKKKYQNLIKRK